MSKILSLAPLIGGINASPSAGSGSSRRFTGNPTDKPIWFLVGGIAAAGAGGLLRGSLSL